LLTPICQLTFSVYSGFADLRSAALPGLRLSPNFSPDATVWPQHDNLS
jgi:hypothetical protein